MNRSAILIHTEEGRMAISSLGQAPTSLQRQAEVFLKLIAPKLLLYLPWIPEVWGHPTPFN